MEPLEIGIGAIALYLLTKTGDKITDEALDAVLPQLKAAIVNLPEQVRDRVAGLGDRVRNRLPAGAEPRQNPVLIAEVLEEPEVAAVVTEVTQQLPKIEIKIDQRKQQGNVLNDQASMTVERIEQNFS